MPVMAASVQHSRYQIRCTTDPAWATDPRGVLYRYDGLRFSRRRPKDAEFSLVPSWQTPSYGWVSMAERGLPVRAQEGKGAAARTSPSSQTQPHMAA
jgi:hypothetical protein